MAQTVQLSALAVGGTIMTQWSGNVVVPTDGIITVDARDVSDLLKIGCGFVNGKTGYQALNAAPAAGAAGTTVASAALSNGTFVIAAQPDVPRQLGVRVDPGTSALTAGTVSLVYTANDGVTTTDAVSVVTAASTPFTVNTSKAVAVLTSAIATGVTGGASPKVQVNTTNSLGVQVDPGFVDFTVLRENTDGTNGTIGTVASTAAAITPTTTPNGTHTYAWSYKYNTGVN